MLGDRKSFVLTQGGVSAEVWLEDLGSGHTSVVIKSLQGTLDVNALFWDLVGGDNSLADVAGLTSAMNMNGVGSPVTWDDAKVVSIPGSHTAQIKVGQSLAPITINANFDAIDAFGIRAGGNKMTDTSVDTYVPLNISVSDAPSVMEGGVLAYTVSLNHVYSKNVTVDVVTGYATDTATGGLDYTAPVFTQITIPAGSLSVNVPVSTINDSLVEGDETASLVISNASAGHIVDDRGVGVIQSEDVYVPPPPVHHECPVVVTFDFEGERNGSDNIGQAPKNFWSLDQWVQQHPTGSYYDTVTGQSYSDPGPNRILLDWHSDGGLDAYTTNIQIHGPDGQAALDTAGSPGNIFLEAKPDGGNFGPDAIMPDLLDGKYYTLTASVLKQEYLGPANADHPGTDTGASVDFIMNGFEHTMHVAATDSHFVNGNEYYDFTMVFRGIAGHDDFLIQSHGSGGNGGTTGDGSGYQGLLIDDVTIRELCGELTTKQVWDFESDVIPTGPGAPGLGIFVQTVPVGWTGSTVEVQGNGYGNHSLFGLDETQYLDTAASPGNVSLTTEPSADVGTGNKAQISISVAAQNLTYPGDGKHYETATDATFDLVFNAQTVHTFKLVEMTGTAFKEFTFSNDVNGQALIGVDGTDSISIVSHNEDPNYTGYSVDHISLKEWIV